MITSNDIWVIGDKRIKYNLELISKARSMADICAGRVYAVMLYENDPDDWIRAGADEIYLLQGLEEISDDSAIAHTLEELLRENMPGTVLFQATVRGRAIAPAVAALLGTGLTADCIDLRMEKSGLLLQKRPAMGDSIIAEIVCEKHRPQMATVRQGVLENPTFQNKPTGKVSKIPIEINPSVTKRSFTAAQNSELLSEADIILAGGAGIGCREGFEYLQRIARQMGACVGASRAAVDAGYAPYSWQIGQTGTAVKPKLYIAVGISGAVHHIVGMNASDYIVAINRDAKAPILSYADYAIIGEWRQVLEEWSLSFQERKV